MHRPHKLAALRTIRDTLAVATAVIVIVGAAARS